MRAADLKEVIHRHLSRTTSSGRFIAEIDGLRFVSIVAVFLFHVHFYATHKAANLYAEPSGADWLTRLLSNGNYGVQLFFAISGFILALPFAERFLGQGRRVSLKRYFSRRLSRLEPPYIINLFVCLVLLAVVNGESLSDTWPHFLASIGYVHNIAFGEHSLINGVAWSLEIEVQFYLLAPFLSLVFAVPGKWQRRGAIASAALVIAAVQTVFGVSEHALLRLTLLNYLQYFLVGFLLADFYLVDWKNDRRRGWQWDAIALVAWLAVPVVLDAGLLIQFLFPALVLVAYTGAFRGVLLGRIFQNRWIAAIGGMCYTTYLYHYLVISTIGRFTLSWAPTSNPTINLCFQIIVLAVPTLVSTAILFVLFEKPFMQPQWPAKVQERVRRVLDRRSGDPLERASAGTEVREGPRLPARSAERNAPVPSAGKRRTSRTPM